MPRSPLVTLLIAAWLTATGCLPASSPRVVTPAPLAGDALYRSSGAVPPPVQLEAMLEDTLVRFHQAAMAGDFAPFIRWKASRVQPGERPDEQAAMARRLALQGADLSSFRGCAPQILEAPHVVDDPALGRTLRTSVAYTAADCRLRMDAVYVEQQGQWKAGPIHFLRL